ncbi:MAG: dual specificity protein phosphatase family protein [Candidatus Riflebacteria bacterium]|nr:dual specificity protein phosphatase family protein [Candidatus Riflebacteria bacterium]
MRSAAAYRCIPLLDGTAPGPEALLAGARWIQARLELGPVYVHCAMGHGRSALFVAAYLLLAGRAGTVEAALAELGRLRPGVHLHPDQSSCLREFLRMLPAAPP